MKHLFLATTLLTITPEIAWAKLAGYVRDWDGRAIEDVRVQWKTRSASGSTTTDRDGRYEIDTTEKKVACSYRLSGYSRNPQLESHEVKDGALRIVRLMKLNP